MKMKLTTKIITYYSSYLCVEIVKDGEWMEQQKQRGGGRGLEIPDFLYPVTI